MRAQVKGYRNTAAVPHDLLPSLREECARVLDDRLTMAVTCFSGYGLDQRGVASGSDEEEE